MSIDNKFFNKDDLSLSEIQKIPPLYKQLNFWERLTLPYRSVHPLYWITVPFYAAPKLKEMLHHARRLSHLYDLHGDRYIDVRYRVFGPSYKRLENIIKNSPNYFRNKDQ